MTDASIVIGIEGNVAGGRVVKRTLDDIATSGRGAQNASSQLKNEFDSLNGSARQLGFLLGGLVGSFSAIAATKSLFRLSDQYTVIENKLKLVTEGTANLAAVQSELVRISDETFTSLSSNATLFSRLTISTRELGASQEDVLNATQALQQTFRISGATAQEAANSTVQFAQGLASGALRGDEFRSVAEQNIRLMGLLADGLGVSRGKLKEMADEGQLTAERIFPILAKSIDQLNKEAEKISPTFEQAFSKISEKFGQGVDEAIRAKTEFKDLGGVIASFGPLSKDFGSVFVGNTVAGLVDIISKLKMVNDQFRQLLSYVKLLPEEEQFSRVPADYGLGPQYTKVTQNEMNVARGGINNVRVPPKKPEIPDSFFLEQAEKKKKAINEAIETDKKSQLSITKTTDALKFQNDQLTRNKLDQEIYNNVRQAGVTLESTAGQRIAELTRQYEQNSTALEKQKRLGDDLASTFDGFFKSALQGADGFKGAVKGLIGSLADMAFQMAVLEPIKQNLFGGGSSGGGIFGSLLGGLGGIFGGGGNVGQGIKWNAPRVGGFDSGGSMVLGGRGGIDQNVISLNGAPIVRTSRGETLSVSPKSGGGNGSGVVINQTINVSTGVQETIAAEMQAFLPKIEQITSAAINERNARGIQ